MSATPLVLFDDDNARAWHPFTLTRPAGELRYGVATLRGRAEHALGLSCAGHVAAPHLAEFDESRAPPVIPADSIPGMIDGTGVVLLRSRFVPEPTALPVPPALLVSGGRVVGCRLGPGDATPDAAFLDDPDRDPPDHPRHELPGTLLDHVWQLMTGNADRLARDLEGAAPSTPPDGVHRIGDGVISIGRGVGVAPGVVLDTRAGPIRIDDGVEVQPFTRLAGPAHVAAGSVLLGGSLSAVSIGPRCKVHGEIEETVVLGYSNKAHDGFIGHAYIGMWVNLGALTTNSDLKNNYGSVRVWTPGGVADTGLTKIGCLIGDHVKTAIGTMINTGTVIGAGSNVFGGMPPAYLPPFSWGDADTPHALDRFLDTARTVMERRDIRLGERAERALAAAWTAAREAGA